MGRPGMSARWNPTASGPGALGGAGGAGGGGAGIYTEQVFNYTGGPQTFNTSNVRGNEITAYVYGPGGGAEADTNTRGGSGGYSTGIIDVSAGGNLKIIVGGHGGPGRQNNGSGAGYTGIFTNSWNGNSTSTDHSASIMLAGGGGGSANSSSGQSHGAGAGGGSSGQRGNPSNSGGLPGTQSGGGQYRQTGGGYCSSGDQCYGQQLRGGVACGGGEGSGGVGWPNQIYGGNYASAAGGNGCNAGGGGAGYYGGAGGGGSPNGGNGGGGSGYIGGHPSYPVSGASTYTGDGETPHSEMRNSPFHSGYIGYGGAHNQNRGNGSHQGGSGKVVITYYAPGSGGGGGAPTPNWDIIMHTNGRKGNESNQGDTQRFGYTGQSSWRSISASSTGADGRTGFGNGVGLYNGYFNKRKISRVALVTGDGDLQSPTSHSKYLVYDLVEDSGSESFHDIINRLDQYNRNQSNWAGQNASGFNSPSVTNFTGNSNGYSGTLNENSGWGGAASNGSTPDRFAVWGINTDSDDDTQVLCSYYGSLSNGKGDSWRGSNPSQTFWSYWGNDWHSNSNSQTISNGRQSHPGIANGSNYSNSLYLVAYGDPM